jgi:hypothetical protein
MFIKNSIRKRLDKIYLHIGFHKTGSTYIQHSLYHSRERLKENGVHLVCLNHYRKKIDYGNAAYLLRRLPRLKKKLALLNGGRAIISSENMSWWDAVEIKKLAKILKANAREIEVIVYLRNHDEYATSMKQQGSKTAHIGRIFGHEEGVLPRVDHKVCERLQYTEVLKLWGTIFGYDNIKITTFDYLKSNNMTLMESMVERFELGSVEISEISRINESIDYYWQRFLHDHQNLLFASKIVRDALIHEVILAGSHGPKVKATTQEQNAFRARFIADVENLKTYFDSSQIVLNKYNSDFQEFVFDRSIYESVKAKFIAIQSATTLELYKNGTLSKKDLHRVIKEMLKVSQESAEALQLEAELK